MTNPIPPEEPADNPLMTGRPMGFGLTWMLFWPIFQVVAKAMIRNLVPYLLDKLRQELLTGQPAAISDSEIESLIQNQHQNLKGTYHARYLSARPANSGGD